MKRKRVVNCFLHSLYRFFDLACRSTSFCQLNRSRMNEQFDPIFIIRPVTTCLPWKLVAIDSSTQCRSSHKNTVQLRQGDEERYDPCFGFPYWKQMKPKIERQSIFTYNQTRSQKCFCRELNLLVRFCFGSQVTWSLSSCDWLTLKDDVTVFGTLGGKFFLSTPRLPGNDRNSYQSLKKKSFSSSYMIKCN